MTSAKYFFCAVLLLLCEFKVLAQVENIKSLQNNTLNIAVTGVNGASRKAYLSVEKSFHKENPGISVHFMVYEAEYFKKNISTILTEKNTVDVVFWQAGERLFTYVRQGLILPVTDIWQKNDYADKFPKSVISGVTINDEVYAIPIVYSMWGMFYNKQLFQQLDQTPPKNWQQFNDLLAKLKQNDVFPIAIGTQQLWFIANWFEYLNVRLNGLAFHQQFIQGGISNLSPEILNVLTYMQELILKGYIIEGYEDYYLKDLLPLIYRKKAGVLLADSASAIHIPKSIEKDIGFFTFPVIFSGDDEMKKFVHATPVNLIFIPKNSKNSELAKKFMTFFARADIQTLFSTTMVQLPAHKLATNGGNKFITIAKQSVEQASGLTLFFDRDIEKQYGSELMVTWRDFLANADVISTAKKMEQSRLQYLQRIKP